MSLNNLAELAFNRADYKTGRALQEENLALRREMGDKLGIANSLGNLASAATLQADFAAARPLFAESLTLRMEMDDKLGIAFLLSNVAEMVVATGTMKRAARLAAAAETLLTSISGALTPDERSRQDKTIATVDDTLGGPTFQSAWRAGQRLTMKEAAELALKEK
jgi:hypothetical protein